jgi:ABC-type glutathione transport system ATPase component
MMAQENTLILNSEDRGGPAQPLLVVRQSTQKVFLLFATNSLLKRRSLSTAVDNVSFSVAKGKTLGIVGESRARQIHHGQIDRALDQS